MPELLAALERDDVTATFFLGGLWACEHPALASMIAKKGHAIANHGWSNKNHTQLRDWEIRQEIVRADDRFVSWFGDRYHPLFRAPFDAMDQRVLAIADALGFRTVHWSIDPLDGEQPPKPACLLAGSVVERSDEDLKGAIVYFHVGVPEIADAIPIIVRDLRERGFDFVPVSAWTSEHLAGANGEGGETTEPPVFPARRIAGPARLVQIAPAELHFASANPYDRQWVDRFTEVTVVHRITTKP